MRSGQARPLDAKMPRTGYEGAEREEAEAYAQNRPARLLIIVWEMEITQLFPNYITTED